MEKSYTQSIAAFGIVFDDQNKILCIQRKETDLAHPFHNKWAVPGGGVDHGEHPRDTVLREVKEETGLTVKLLSDYPIVKSYLYENHTDQGILLFYPAKYVSGDIHTEHEIGVSDVRWFRYEEINETEFVPSTKSIIAEARKILNT